MVGYAQLLSGEAGSFPRLVCRMNPANCSLGRRRWRGGGGGGEEDLLVVPL